MPRALRLLLLAGMLAAVGCSGESPDAGAPIADTGSTSTVGSCVEQYSIDALKKRDYAFDGTVRSVDASAEDGPDRVVFDVREWYKGGMGPAATKTAYGFAATTSAGGSPHAVGEQLLVAGDEDFVWECGFTQPYDASVAADWEDVRLLAPALDEIQHFVGDRIELEGDFLVDRLPFRRERFLERVDGGPERRRPAPQ